MLRFSQFRTRSLTPEKCEQGNELNANPHRKGVHFWDLEEAAGTVHGIASHKFWTRTDFGRIGKIL